VVVRPAVRASVVLRPSSVCCHRLFHVTRDLSSMWNSFSETCQQYSSLQRASLRSVSRSLFSEVCVTVVGMTCDSGYCAMWMRSPCYRCQTEVAPTRICPPTTRNDRRSNNIHQCAAPNCVGHRYDHMAGHVGRRPHYVRGTYIHRAVSI